MKDDHARRVLKIDRMKKRLYEEPWDPKLAEDIRTEQAKAGGDPPTLEEYRAVWDAMGSGRRDWRRGVKR